jgi:L,D-transpeptidase ErfK/SrfK
LLALLAVALTAGVHPKVARLQWDVIGIPTFYMTGHSENLLDIARDFDLGYVEIRAANPGVDPWLPGEGKELVVPTQFVLPDAPRHGIVINLPELRLYYFPAKGEPLTFPIGIGREGYETPVGHTRIASKRVHPVWIPTASEHEESPSLRDKVGPGPMNPMGEYALYLAWPGYAIHGTNHPYSIGRRDSHGCVRLYPEDIEKLYRLIEVDTPVTIVNQPAKVGWSAGELYLEIHPTQEDADALETEGAPRSSIAIDADSLVIAAAGDDAPRLDWYTIHLAEFRRDGVAVQITRPVPY